MSVTMRFRNSVRFAALSLLLACAARAQGTGEITGTVSDPSGAAIGGAKVTVTNTGTAAERSVTTNETGNYDLPALQPGMYTIKVEFAGFRNTERKDVELQVGRVARFDFSLQLGNVSDTVEVSGGAPVIETENASLGTVIENRRIIDLPLNGRNPLQLVSLTPGATTNGPASSQGQQRMGGNRNAFSLNVAGQRTSNNHYELDGVENTDPNFNTYLFLPSVDALQEFKVESGTYGAEYGRGLSQVNMTTRSGTNEYHGALFEFLRNSNLDAKNFFDPSGPIAPFKRNQFGGTVGGPVSIPKLFNGKDKLFFFFDYEALRERKAQTAIFNVPPAQNRDGNFAGSSAVIFDPATRVVDASGKVVSQTPFAGNVIPANRVTPTATATLKNWYPLPNRGNTSGYTLNYISNEGRRTDEDQVTARGDYVMNSTSTFMGRFSRAHDSAYLPLTTQGLGYNNDVVAWQGVVGHTLVPGRGNKVNEFRFSVARLAAANEQPSANKNNFVSSLGIGGVPTNIAEYWGVPVFQFGGGSISTVGECSDCPFVNHDTIFQWVDNFTWTKGKHTFRFGTDDRRVRYNQIGAVVARGRFTFNGTYTGDPALSSPPAQNTLADFLLGDIATSEGQSGAPIAGFRSYSMNIYAADSWKVSSKLTVNYGLRYEIEPPFTDKYDNIVNIAFNWDDSVLPKYVRAGKGDFYGGNPPPSFQLPAGVPNTRGMFGNRAYQTSYKDIAPRLGLAYSLDEKTVIRAGAGIYYVRDIGNAQFDLVRNAPFSTRRSENAQSTLIPSLTWQVPFVQTATPSFILVNQYNQNTPYVPQWSIGMQRQVTVNSSLEITYLGSAGVHLQRLLTYNTATPGPPTNINNRRPQFPTYGGTFQVMADPSHASYHALQARFQQRFSHGVTFLSSYSWSKSIDNGSGIRTVDGDSLTPSNDHNLSLDRGLSAFDFRHRSTTSFLYELPIGKGRTIGGGFNRMTDMLVGGWQVGGIVTLQSGFPFTLYCGSGSVQNGGDNCYPDSLGGASNLASDQRGPSKWFNTANFVNRINDPSLPLYRYGNNARNNVIGPPLVDVDFSTMKTFRFGEKRGLEFRTEFFNLLNHPIFGQPNATVGTASFGTISGTRVDSRQIQFALKLNY